MCTCPDPVATVHAQVALGCAKLITTGAERLKEAGSAPLPFEDPFRIYYPGDALMGRLLARAARLAQHGELSVWGSAQLVGACGELGYWPEEGAWRALLAGARKGRHSL